MIGFDAVGKRGTKPVRSQHFFDMNRQRPAVKRIKRVYRRPTDGGRTDSLLRGVRKWQSTPARDSRPIGTRLGRPFPIGPAGPSARA